VNASERRAVLTAIVSVAALLVAAVLVWAATTGPVGVVGELPRSESGNVLLGSDQPAPAEDTADDPSPNESADPLGDGPDVDWLADLFTFLLLLGALWVAALALRQLVTRLARDDTEEQPDLDVTFTADAAVAREALARDRERHEAALAGGDIRNGVVACWVLLEEAAAAAGFPRRPSETPTEFVVHVLHALDVDPRPVAELAGLYHEARFSSHQLSDGARARAEAALAGDHAGLSAAGVAR
jgi:hypothetical protein